MKHWNVRVVTATFVLAAPLCLGQGAHAGVPNSPESRGLKLHSSFHGRAPHGGFGGAANCGGRVHKVPVIFLHGNGDFAGNWATKASNGGPSVLETFRAAGYTDCELFGVSYLADSEREHTERNYHERSKAEIVSNFIKDVLDYTDSPEVDVVGHSLGVTMGLFSIDRADLWSKVRKFVAVAGAMRGIFSCAAVGFMNALAPTCGSANWLSSDIFGFFPDGLMPVAPNPRMGEGEMGFANLPRSARSTKFYSIRAGTHDQIVCGATVLRPQCARSSTFNPDVDNVVAQVDVGAGSDAPLVVLPTQDIHVLGGDANGVGHMRAKTDTGAVQVNMLSGSCTGAGCCDGYQGSCDANFSF